MNKILIAPVLTALLLLATAGTISAAAAPATAKPAQSTIVIIFKDGHRQTFNLADIARVEFAGSDLAAGGAPLGPSRAHFFGKWEVGQGNGDNFYITLHEDGTALRSLGDEHGTWKYVNGEAQVTWDDGAKDAIRKVGSDFQKFAYGEGKSFTGTADNVTNARNLTQNPTGVD